jgi:hypothetical protein
VLNAVSALSEISGLEKPDPVNLNRGKTKP